MTLKNDERTLMIKHHIEKARESLKDSQNEENSNATRANRAYYSAFYCANALLLTQKVERNSHKGVLSEFGRLFVKTGEFPEDVGGYLRDLERVRYSADYSVSTQITNDDAEKSCRKSQIFYQTSIEKLRTIWELSFDSHEPPSPIEEQERQSPPAKKMSFLQRQYEANKNDRGR